jgi:hypothetical protein
VYTVFSLHPNHFEQLFEDLTDVAFDRLKAELMEDLQRKYHEVCPLRSPASAPSHHVRTPRRILVFGAWLPGLARFIACEVIDPTTYLQLQGSINESRLETCFDLVRFILKMRVGLLTRTERSVRIEGAGGGESSLVCPHGLFGVVAG